MQLSLVSSLIRLSTSAPIGSIADAALRTSRRWERGADVGWPPLRFPRAEVGVRGCRGVSGGLPGAAGGVEGSAERPEGLGRAAPTLSAEGLQAGILTRSCCASGGPGPCCSLIFYFFLPPPPPQILRGWPGSFLTEGRVTRCPALWPRCRTTCRRKSCRRKVRACGSGVWAPRRGVGVRVRACSGIEPFFCCCKCQSVRCQRTYCPSPPIFSTESGL